jgi:hypothetical protein
MGSVQPRCAHACSVRVRGDGGDGRLQPPPVSSRQQAQCKRGAQARLQGPTCLNRSATAGKPTCARARLVARFSASFCSDVNIVACWSSCCQCGMPTVRKMSGNAISPTPQCLQLVAAGGNNLLLLAATSCAVHRAGSHRARELGQELAGPRLLRAAAAPPRAHGTKPRCQAGSCPPSPRGAGAATHSDRWRAGRAPGGGCAAVWGRHMTPQLLPRDLGRRACCAAPRLPGCQFLDLIGSIKFHLS